MSVRILPLAALALLSACSWLGLHKQAPPPDPTQLLVTGSPQGSLVFIDGAPVGPPADSNNQTRVLDVAPGLHQVEIQVNGKFVYREETSVEAGKRRTVIVKSGYGANQFR